MKALFFDLETTGTYYWKHGIHQISGLVEIDGKIVDQFNYKVQPYHRAKIETEALNVAGVDLETIKNYRPMKEVYNEFISLLSKYVNKYNKKDKFFLIGYNNASFDDKFLRAFFVQNDDQFFGSWFWSNSIDVMVLASFFLADKRTEMIDFKLSTVAEFLGIEIDKERLHDALYDVEITREIYKKLK